MTWWLMVVVAVTGALPAAPDKCSEQLVRLDHARAAAFAAGNSQALDQVYVASSRLAEADAATMDSFESRGGRVKGALLHISHCRVIEESDTSMRLEVVDALGPAYVRWADGSTSALPRDEATRRWVTLRLTSDGWRISGSQPPEPS